MHRLINRLFRSTPLLLRIAALVLGLWGMPQPQACVGDAPPPPSDRFFPLAYGTAPSENQLRELGRKLFFDPTLSASGKQSCASCHSPAHAYGPPNALAIQPGGPHLDRLGVRSTPSLRYLHTPRPFTEHYIDLADHHGQDSGPAGGRTWDGRVNLARDQALMPLLDPVEMANADRGDLVARLRHAPYADDFLRAFSPPGGNVFDNVDMTLGWLSMAIEYFEQSPDDFHPFTSKYDAHLRGHVKLSASEQRGLRLFNDKNKGNCASCHPSTRDTTVPGSLPIFTDFEFSALGVPRNQHTPANADPAFYDMGLCGPFRTDLQDKPHYCGRFRTPSLRNVGTRHAFFHNGSLHSLEDVLRFYVTRDLTPQRWYGRDQRGRVVRFNDLPPAYRGNVSQDIPFKPLPGGQPRLSAADIKDVAAFLRTLSDGYHHP